MLCFICFQKFLQTGGSLPNKTPVSSTEELRIVEGEGTAPDNTEKGSYIKSPLFWDSKNLKFWDSISPKF